jgi:hypothetical protein
MAGNGGVTYDTRGYSSSAQINARNNLRVRMGREWPESRETRIAEVIRRRRSYLALGYSDAEVRDMGLFRALDSANNISAEAQRLYRDIAFVVNVDAASIASPEWRVSVDSSVTDEDARAALRVQIDQVWEASKIDERRHLWARTVCSEGEALLEVVQTAAAIPRIVLHPYEAYQLTYDRTGIDVIRAIIDVVLPPEETVMPDGSIEMAPEPRRYRRILTPTDVRAYVDGVLIAEESGPNPLGVVPVVRLCFMPVLDGSFCCQAGYGYDAAVAAFDSYLKQIQTLGTRHSNPLVVGVGVDLGENATLQQQGRTVAIPQDSDLKYLEPSFAGADVIVKTMESARAAMVQTLPEFMFADASASSSGAALSLRSQAFVGFISPIREAFFDGAELAMGYALAMMTNTPWGEGSDVVEIDGGPAVSQDVTLLARLYAELANAGFMTSEDVIKHLQAMGVTSDSRDPGEYARAAQAELQARQGGTIDAIQRAEALLRMLQMDGVGAIEGMADDTPDPAEPSPETPAA